MAARTAKISLIALLAGSGLGFAADRAQSPVGFQMGAPTPAPQTPLDPSDYTNPEVVENDKFGAPCQLQLSSQEEGQIRERAGVQVGNECMPQADAFKRAAEASSYLAIYQQYYSSFGASLNDPKGGEETKKIYNEAVRVCVTEPSSECSKSHQALVVRALMQYNYGKELKAQMLENQLRSENMASVKMDAKDWKALNARPTILLPTHKGEVRGSTTLRTKTFRLNPHELQMYDFNKHIEGREQLGQDFNRGFDQFVNEYSSSVGQRGLKSRWFYVPAKSSGASGEVWVPSSGSENGTVALDTARSKRDMDAEEKPEVREALESYRKGMKAALARPRIERKEIDPNTGKETIVSRDSIEATVDSMGFGLVKTDEIDPATNKPVTPAVIAQGVVTRIDKDIYMTEKANRDADDDERVPSSVSTGKGKDGRKTVSVMINPEKFDAFLESIWPTHMKGAQKN